MNLYIGLNIISGFLFFIGLIGFFRHRKRLKNFKKNENYKAKAGRVGENQVAKVLSGLRVPIFHDICLRYGKNKQYTMQLDHVVVGNDKIIILETKNHKSLSDNLIQTSLNQNKTHVSVMSEFLNVQVGGIVVLTGGAGREADDRLAHGVKLPYGVLSISRIAPIIGGICKGKGYQDANIKKAIKILESLNQQDKQKFNKDHVSRLRKRYGGQSPRSSWCIMIIAGILGFLLANNFQTILFSFHEWTHVM